jgi:hypothetical protein
LATHLVDDVAVFGTFAEDFLLAATSVETLPSDDPLILSKFSAKTRERV